MKMPRVHRMPFGAELQPDGRVRFRLWAPAANLVHVQLEHGSGPERLHAEPVGDGWFERITDRAAAGTRYRFVIDDDALVADVASRFQPEDVHGPSEVIDPAAFAWTDPGWRGRPWEETLLYELHVGTFTPGGTFRSAAERLDHVADTGFTALEIMPVADFAGQRNWGYDGVLPFAPDSAYGRPDDFKAFIDAAHARHLMVFLDVVYNHFGPAGNALHRYAPQFFTHRHSTPWGEAIDFTGEGNDAVREFVIHNALFWLEEYHLDGLRLDSVHAIFDERRPDILTELAAAVRNGPGAERHVHLVLENDDNRASCLSGHEQNGNGYTAQWNDDAHHALHVVLTGETDGYYSDYAGAPVSQLGRALAEGFVYQGEHSRFRDRPRGESSAHLPPTAFVPFLQNHDQIGNRAMGDRIATLAPAEAIRAAHCILLLSPSPPLFFMGEEFGSEQPFLFFCDFEGDLADAVRNGRRQEFARFDAFAAPESLERIPDPNALETFERCVLDWKRLDTADGVNTLAEFRALIALRRNEIVPRIPGMRGNARHHTSGDTGLRVEWQLGDGSLLTLLANLGEQRVTWSQPRGRLLYAVPELPPALDDLPPWSVAAYLAEPTPPSE